MEMISFHRDGSIPQVEMTSCGPNGRPLEGKGEYSAYLACNLFTSEAQQYTGGFGAGAWLDSRFPIITQDGRDGDEETGYIANMIESATAGFKYFDCNGIQQVTVKVRGYCNGYFEVKTSWDGPVLGTIPVHFTNVWKPYTASISIPDGKQALYFTYRGMGGASLASFILD